MRAAPRAALPQEVKGEGPHPLPRAQGMRGQYGGLLPPGTTSNMAPAPTWRLLAVEHKPRPPELSACGRPPLHPGLGFTCHSILEDHRPWDASSDGGLPPCPRGSPGRTAGAASHLGCCPSFQPCGLQGQPACDRTRGLQRQTPRLPPATGLALRRMWGGGASGLGAAGSCGS